jgi:RNA polymerase sigma-70 factor (ECF subfamily)
VAPTPDPDDEAIVAEYLRSRDPDLFRLLVERHQERVFRLVAAILGPFADLDAEELTQEVFVRMHERLDSFRGESRFSTWLHRLAYNRTIERRRRARLRFAHVPWGDLQGSPTQDGPYEAALESERVRAVARLVEELPDVYRSVVHMHYWMDQSVEEIAGMLDVPPGTVKSYLARARARLRERAKARGVEGWRKRWKTSPRS